MLKKPDCENLTAKLACEVLVFLGHNDYVSN